MECHKCSDDLTAYIDGELPGPAAEEMSAHLEKCKPCLVEFQNLRDSAIFVESHSTEVEPAPEIWNNLRARIAEMPVPSDSSGLFRFLVVHRWAAAAASLAATVILALSLWGYLQYQESQAQFESYMDEYLLTRSVAERLHAVQLRQAQFIYSNGDSPVPIALENPFSEMRPVAFTNPFRSEER